MISIYGIEKSKIEKVLEEKMILDKCVIEGKDLDYKIEYDNDILLDALDCFKDNIYSLCNMSLAETLAHLLIDNNIKFSVAESLTGGSIASALVKVPGISAVFMEGLVCYSYESKHTRLNIPNEMLDKYGAVSYEVCDAMLKGQDKYGVTLSMATTGIAGPLGESHEDTLGLTYIGTKVNDDISVKKYIFPSNRESVINAATNVCLGNAIVKILLHLNIDLKNENDRIKIEKIKHEMR